MVEFVQRNRYECNVACVDNGVWHEWHAYNSEEAAIEYSEEYDGYLDDGETMVVNVRKSVDDLEPEKFHVINENVKCAHRIMT